MILRVLFFALAAAVCCLLAAILGAEFQAARDEDHLAAVTRRFETELEIEDDILADCLTDQALREPIRFPADTALRAL